MHKAAGSEPTKGQLMAEINAAVASKLRELGSRGWFPATPKKGSATPKKGSPSKAAAVGKTRCLGIRAGRAPVHEIDKRRLRSKRGLAPSGAGAEAPSGSAAKASSRTEAPGATPTDAAEEVEMKGGGDLELFSLLPGAATEGGGGGEEEEEGEGGALALSSFLPGAATEGGEGGGLSPSSFPPGCADA